jgi:hypothetical protein
MRTAENLDRGLLGKAAPGYHRAIPEHQTRRMKLKTWHWAAIAALLIALWLGLMVWLSYVYLRDKDPVPAGEWEKRERVR